MTESDRPSPDVLKPDILKTYKLYVGGAFPRSESGRVYLPRRCPSANVARGSRKDVRDAVVAARKAQAGWWGRTGYNRGQIFYRLAEMLQSRCADFVAEMVACGCAAADAREEVEQAIALTVWYAGLPDKLDSLLGSQNPVSGPYVNYSTFEPSGVVAVLAPNDSMLLGLLAMLLPVLAGGNTAVALGSEDAPLAAVALGEACATADVPPGVVNLLTGQRGELAEHLFAHGDIDGVFASGPPDGTLAALAAEGVTRVRFLPEVKWEGPDGPVPSPRQLAWVEPFVEIKTVWHPTSAR